MDEASRRKTQLQRQLSASISSLKQSRAGSACSTQSHLSSASKLSFNCKTIQDDWFKIALRRSRPVSNCSFGSLTPITSRTSNNSSAQSNRTVIPEIETKTNEISTRLQQLQSNAAFLVRDVVS